MVKFSSKAISEHAEVPLADEGRWENIVQHYGQQQRPVLGDATAVHDRASYVVSVGSDRDPRARAAQLAEITSLVEHQGGRVAGQEIYHLARPNPRTLLGKGTAQELAQRARACGATMLVLDAELSPSQARNLEDTDLPRRHYFFRRILPQLSTATYDDPVDISQVSLVGVQIRGFVQ